MNSILKIILLIGCLLQTTSAQAGFLLVFSTSGNSEEAITEITGDVGQTFTVTVFVREEGGDILNTYGLFGFGIRGSYQASALNPVNFQDTSAPIRLTSDWTVDPAIQPLNFSNGNFLLWGQASDPNVAVKPIPESNELKLGEFQFTIAQAGTIDFSFFTNDPLYEWLYEAEDSLQKPEFEEDQVNLNITGVPEPGALGLMMIVSWAVLSVQRKRRP